MYLLVALLFVLGVRGQSFSNSINKFSVELLYFTHQEVNGNVAVSPFGVWSVLAGVTSGATDASRRQLLEALRLPSDDEDIKSGFRNISWSVLNNRMVQSKNNLYYHMDLSLARDFENNLNDNFTIFPLKLDFQQTESAALVVNTLMSDAGMINQNFIQPKDFERSGVILTSLIKVRGLFRSPFSKGNTRVQPFYADNYVANVNMMQQIGLFSYSHIDGANSEVLELPYNENVSLVVILPNENASLQTVYEGFAETKFKNVMGTLERAGKKAVSVSLPRFKNLSNLILNSPLISKGLGVFVPGASFEKAGRGFFISKLIHLADVEVTESGRNVSNELMPTEFFVANRPFVYMIVEKTTNVSIISGVYEKPILY